jgi:hypothetical protein
LVAGGENFTSPSNVQSPSKRVVRGAGASCCLRYEPRLAWTAAKFENPGAYERSPPPMRRASSDPGAAVTTPSPPPVDSSLLEATSFTVPPGVSVQ